MKELIAYETWHGVMWLDGEDQGKTWLDGLVASVKGKSEAKHWNMWWDAWVMTWRWWTDATMKSKWSQDRWTNTSHDDMKWIISFVMMLVKDRLGDQRGGSEWEPIKILLQGENSAYTPKSQPRIPTRVCQGRVVTTDLPTLGKNPKRSQSESETQRSKGLSCPANTLADSLRP
jgi:hypothetical protein